MDQFKNWEEMLAFCLFQVYHRCYSVQEQLQLYQQRPGARAVASREQWAKMGRRPREGVRPLTLSRQDGLIREVWDLEDTVGPDMKLWRGPEDYERLARVNELYREAAQRYPQDYGLHGLLAAEAMRLRIAYQETRPELLQLDQDFVAQARELSRSSRTIHFEETRRLAGLLLPLAREAIASEDREFAQKQLEQEVEEFLQDAFHWAPEQMASQASSYTRLSLDSLPETPSQEVSQEQQPQPQLPDDQPQELETAAEDEDEPEVTEAERQEKAAHPDWVDFSGRVDIPTTEGERLRANLAALTLLRQLEAEERPALTQEEQETLARFTGWGGLPRVFDEAAEIDENDLDADELVEEAKARRSGRQTKAEMIQQLRKLLSPEELQAAQRASLTSYFTPHGVSELMFELVERFGLREGTMLEPGCGVGNFIQKSGNFQVTGIELDRTTAAIAQKLYPQSDIRHQDFAEAKLKHNSYDLVIGNVPFENIRIFDPERHERLLIHEHFLKKSMASLKPYGLMAVVVSSGVMDKEDSKFRSWLCSEAKLLAAHRLNSSVFANTGAEVSADLLIFQKRPQPSNSIEPWVYERAGEGVNTVNILFIPERRGGFGRKVLPLHRGLGHFVLRSRGFYNSVELENNTVDYPELQGRDLSFANEDPERTRILADAIMEEAGPKYEAPPTDTVAEVEEKDGILPRPENYEIGVYVQDGKEIFLTASETMRRVTEHTEYYLARDYIQLRQGFNELIQYMEQNAGDEQLQRLQLQLRSLYEQFTLRHGKLNGSPRRPAYKLLSQDDSLPQLQALEELNQEGEVIGLAAIFTERTIRAKSPGVTPEHSMEDILTWHLANDRDFVMERLKELSQKSEEEIAAALGDRILQEPYLGQGRELKWRWVLANSFFATHIGNKQAQLRELAEELTDAKEKERVEALIALLEDHRPPRIEAKQVKMPFTAQWIPAEDKNSFFQDGDDYKGIRLNFSAGQQVYTVTSPYHSPNIIGNKDMPGLIEDYLNGKSPVYKEKEFRGNKEVTVTNPQNTRLVTQFREALEKNWEEWLIRNPEVRERLVDLYNERFNQYCHPTYTGRGLELPGSNPNIALRDSQKASIERCLRGGNTLLSHSVGAGKTYVMIASIMEAKRLGLANKPMVVVPKALLGQWRREFYKLYPGAKVLSPGPEDFSKDNRRRFLSKVASGNYDAVIVSYEQFKRIPLSTKTREMFFADELQKMNRMMVADKAQGIKVPKRVRSAILANYEAMLKIRSDFDQDEGLSFEQLGVDSLVIDECHNFKNLFTYSRYSDISGIVSSDSQRSLDLLSKCQYIQRNYGPRGVLFASGSPIANSLSEIHTLFRYLRPDMLGEMGLEHFDSWVSTYAEIGLVRQLDETGQGFKTARKFKAFNNLDSLITTFRNFADVRMKNDLQLETPEVEMVVEEIQPSDEVLAYIQTLGERADTIREKKVDPSVDNLLKIVGEGKRVAIDLRLMEPWAEASEDSKVERVAQRIFEEWAKHRETKGTQLVFCDMGTPKPGAHPKRMDGEFTNVYDAIVTKLNDKGIPMEEMEYIHGFEQPAAKLALFDRMNEGKVRILFGSTAKLGEGVNVQRKLVAIHDVDAPWRPSDLEQRRGRIERVGNENKQVRVYRYITKNTFDAYSYQLLENKQRMITAVLAGQMKENRIEDWDQATMDYKHIKAAACGNPLITRFIELEDEVNNLKEDQKAFFDNQEKQRQELAGLPQRRERLERRLEGLEADLRKAEASKDSKKLRVEHYSNLKLKKTRKDQSLQISRGLMNINRRGEQLLGLEYRGFGLVGSYNFNLCCWQLRLSGKSGCSIDVREPSPNLLARIDSRLAQIPDLIEEVKEDLAEITSKEQFLRRAVEDIFDDRELVQKTRELELIKLELGDDALIELITREPEHPDDDFDIEVI